MAAGLVLIAFNLRLAVTSVAPILHAIMAETSLAPAGASLLATLPALCFGLFAPVAPVLVRRFGPERALLAVTAAMAAGSALRGIPALPALFGGTIIASAAIGVGNALLPAAVKRDFPHRVPMLTGLYTAALCAGAAVAAGASVPLTQAFGSWSAALAVWAVPALLAAALWAPQMPARPARIVTSGRGGLWRDALAWRVTLFMGLQSALAYIVFAWLAPMLEDRGMDAASAGLAVSVCVIVSAVACIPAPMLATRGRDQRAANAGGIVVCVAALLGCLFAPLWAVWGFAALLGASQGWLIAVALTVIVLRAPDARAAAVLSGMAQSVGYLLASAGPLLAGLLRTWTGSWASLGVLTVAIGAAAIWAGIGAGRDRLVRG